MPAFESTAEESSDEELYSLLNLSRQASILDVQRAYKRLSRVFHPDKSPSLKEEAERTFVAIKQAHDVLADPILRLAYNHGGLLVVNLIKRSQQQQQQHNSSHNLYTELQKCATEDEAVSLIHRWMQDERWNRQQHDADGLNHQTSLSGTASFPYDYSYRRLEGKESNIQVQSTLRKGDTWSLTIGGNGSVQHTALVDLSTSVSADYQPQRGTHITVDSSLRAGQARPHMSIRTSRQMANGTFLVAGLGGNLQSSQSWAYNIVSYRNIMATSFTALFSDQPPADEEQQTQKLQASWRMSLRPASGQLQQALLTLKARYFPQWSVRIGLGTFPFKASLQPGEFDTPYLAYSWGLTFHRVKLAWIQDLGNDWCDWTLKYGIKYDGRGLIQPGFVTLWTVFFQLTGDDWTINLPISLFQNVAWPVASMITLLLSQWVDYHLSDLLAVSRDDESSTAGEDVPEPAVAPQPSPYERFHNMIEAVARKKRAVELSNPQRCLVILAATRSTVRGTRVDIRDLIQFWVTNRQQVDVSMNEVSRWLSTTGASETGANTASSLEWSLWKSFWKGHSAADARPTMEYELLVRYNHNGTVYEVRFNEAEDERLVLPNPRRAVELGQSTRVS